MVHCRTYSTAVSTCYREKLNNLEAARPNRIERTCRSRDDRVRAKVSVAAESTWLAGIV